MSKVAVIYTGETRTIETTINYLKSNVLINNNYHVFAVIQTDNTDYYNKVITETLGSNLKNVTWFDKNDSTWLNIRENQLKKIHISDSWINYLRRSGSMTEYYQMYIAYNLLEKYEREHNISYDFVLRTRTDVILKDIIDFDHIFEKNYNKQILHKIKHHLNTNTIISEEVLYKFMNSFYNEKRVCYDIADPIVKYKAYYFDKLLRLKDEEEFIESLLYYLKNERYIITLRKNVVYFIKRDLMSDISLLGLTYGDYKHEENNDYWFNSETQLEYICIKNNIDIFNSTTKLEDNSLYIYNHVNYFNEENKLKNDNFSFFIKRY
jgi:hypothetical protein